MLAPECPDFFKERHPFFPPSHHCQIFNGSPMFSESDLTQGTQLSLTDPSLLLHLTDLNQDHQAVDQTQRV